MAIDSPKKKGCLTFLEGKIVCWELTLWIMSKDHYAHVFMLLLFIAVMVVFFFLCRLIVVLQEKTYIYDLNSLAILDTIDTVPNSKGQNRSRYLLILESVGCTASLILSHPSLVIVNIFSYKERWGVLKMIIKLTFHPSLFCLSYCLFLTSLRMDISFVIFRYNHFY